MGLIPVGYFIIGLLFCYTAPLLGVPGETTDDTTRSTPRHFSRDDLASTFHTVLQEHFRALPEQIRTIYFPRPCTAPDAVFEEQLTDHLAHCWNEENYSKVQRTFVTNNLDLLEIKLLATLGRYFVMLGLKDIKPILLPALKKELSTLTETVVSVVFESCVVRKLYPSMILTPTSPGFEETQDSSSETGEPPVYQWGDQTLLSWLDQGLNSRLGRFIFGRPWVDQALNSRLCRSILGIPSGPFLRKIQRVLPEGNQQAVTDLISRWNDLGEDEDSVLPPKDHQILLQNGLAILSSTEPRTFKEELLKLKEVLLDQDTQMLRERLGIGNLTSAGFFEKLCSLKALSETERQTILQQNWNWSSHWAFQMENLCFPALNLSDSRDTQHAKIRNSLATLTPPEEIPAHIIDFVLAQFQESNLYQEQRYRQDHPYLYRLQQIQVYGPQFVMLSTTSLPLLHTVLRLPLLLPKTQGTYRFDEAVVYDYQGVGVNVTTVRYEGPLPTRFFVHPSRSQRIRDPSVLLKRCDLILFPPELHKFFGRSLDHCTTFQATSWNSRLHAFSSVDLTSFPWPYPAYFQGKVLPHRNSTTAPVPLITDLSTASCPRPLQNRTQILLTGTPLPDPETTAYFVNPHSFEEKPVHNAASHAHADSIVNQAGQAVAYILETIGKAGKHVTFGVLNSVLQEELDGHRHGTQGMTPLEWLSHFLNQTKITPDSSHHDRRNKTEILIRIRRGLDSEVIIADDSVLRRFYTPEQLSRIEEVLRQAPARVGYVPFFGNALLTYGGPDMNYVIKSTDRLGVGNLFHAKEIHDFNSLYNSARSGTPSEEYHLLDSKAIANRFLGEGDPLTHKIGDIDLIARQVTRTGYPSYYYEVKDQQPKKPSSYNLRTRDFIQDGRGVFGIFPHFTQGVTVGNRARESYMEVTALKTRSWPHSFLVYQIDLTEASKEIHFQTVAEYVAVELPKLLEREEITEENLNTVMKRVIDGQLSPDTILTRNSLVIDQKHIQKIFYPNEIIYWNPLSIPPPNLPSQKAILISFEETLKQKTGFPKDNYEIGALLKTLREHLGDVIEVHVNPDTKDFTIIDPRETQKKPRKETIEKLLVISASHGSPKGRILMSNDESLKREEAAELFKKIVTQTQRHFGWKFLDSKTTIQVKISACEVGKKMAEDIKALDKKGVLQKLLAEGKNQQFETSQQVVGYITPIGRALHGLGLSKNTEVAASVPEIRYDGMGRRLDYVNEDGIVTVGDYHEKVVQKWRKGSTIPKTEYRRRNHPSIEFLVGEESAAHPAARLALQENADQFRQFHEENNIKSHERINLHTIKATVHRTASGEEETAYQFSVHDIKKPNDAPRTVEITDGGILKVRELVNEFTDSLTDHFDVDPQTAEFSFKAHPDTNSETAGTHVSRGLNMLWNIKTLADLLGTTEAREHFSFQAAINLGCFAHGLTRDGLDLAENFLRATGRASRFLSKAQEVFHSLSRPVAGITSGVNIIFDIEALNKAQGSDERTLAGLRLGGDLTMAATLAAETMGLSIPGVDLALFSFWIAEEVLEENIRLKYHNKLLENFESQLQKIKTAYEAGDTVRQEGIIKFGTVLPLDSLNLTDTSHVVCDHGELRLRAVKYDKPLYGPEDEEQDSEFTIPDNSCKAENFKEFLAHYSLPTALGIEAQPCSAPAIPSNPTIILPSKPNAILGNYRFGGTSLPKEEVPLCRAIEENLKKAVQFFMPECELTVITGRWIPQETTTSVWLPPASVEPQLIASKLLKPNGDQLNLVLHPHEKGGVYTVVVSDNRKLLLKQNTGKTAKWVVVFRGNAIPYPQKNGNTIFVTRSTEEGPEVIAQIDFDDVQSLETFVFRIPLEELDRSGSQGGFLPGLAVAEFPFRWMLGGKNNDELRLAAYIYYPNQYLFDLPSIIRQRPGTGLCDAQDIYPRAARGLDRCWDDLQVPFLRPAMPHQLAVPFFLRKPTNQPLEARAANTPEFQTEFYVTDEPPYLQSCRATGLSTSGTFVGEFDEGPWCMNQYGLVYTPTSSQNNSIYDLRAIFPGSVFTAQMWQVPQNNGTQSGIFQSFALSGNEEKVVATYLLDEQQEVRLVEFTGPSSFFGNFTPSNTLEGDGGEFLKKRLLRKAAEHTIYAPLASPQHWKNVQVADIIRVNLSQNGRPHPFFWIDTRQGRNQILSIPESSEIPDDAEAICALGTPQDKVGLFYSAQEKALYRINMETEEEATYDEVKAFWLDLNASPQVIYQTLDNDIWRIPAKGLRDLVQADLSKHAYQISVLNEFQKLNDRNQPDPIIITGVNQEREGQLYPVPLWVIPKKPESVVCFPPDFLMRNASVSYLGIFTDPEEHCLFFNPVLHQVATKTPLPFEVTTHLLEKLLSRDPAKGVWRLPEETSPFPETLNLETRNVLAEWQNSTKLLFPGEEILNVILEEGEIIAATPLYVLLREPEPQVDQKRVTLLSLSAQGHLALHHQKLRMHQLAETYNLKAPLLTIVEGDIQVLDFRLPHPVTVWGLTNEVLSNKNIDGHLRYLGYDLKDDTIELAITNTHTRKLYQCVLTGNTEDRRSCTARPQTQKFDLMGPALFAMKEGQQAFQYPVTPETVKIDEIPCLDGISNLLITRSASTSTVPLDCFLPARVLKHYDAIFIAGNLGSSNNTLLQPTLDLRDMPEVFNDGNNATHLSVQFIKVDQDLTVRWFIPDFDEPKAKMVTFYHWFTTLVQQSLNLLLPETEEFKHLEPNGNFTVGLGIPNFNGTKVLNLVDLKPTNRSESQKTDII